MNAEQRELFRLALLRVLDANHTRYGLGVAALCHLAGLFGFRAARTDDVADHVRFVVRRDDRDDREVSRRPHAPLP